MGKKDERGNIDIETARKIVLKLEIKDKKELQALWRAQCNNIIDTIKIDQLQKIIYKVTNSSTITQEAFADAIGMTISKLKDYNRKAARKIDSKLMTKEEFEKAYSGKELPIEMWAKVFEMPLEELVGLLARGIPLVQALSDKNIPTNGYKQSARPNKENVQLKGFIIYECEKCKRKRKIYLVKGIEDGDGKPPAPFDVKCFACDGVMRDINPNGVTRLSRAKKVEKGDWYFGIRPEADRGILFEKI